MDTEKDNHDERRQAYINRVNAQIDRLANRIKKMVLNTDYINISRATQIMKNVHNELDHSKMLKKIKTAGCQVKQTVCKPGLKDIPNLPSIVKMDETPELIYLDDYMQVTKQEGFYSILDKQTMRTTNIKILGNDYSNSYNPIRQKTTLSSCSNVKQVVDTFLMNYTIDTPYIAIPSGEGKTTLVQRFNSRVQQTTGNGDKLIVIPDKIDALTKPQFDDIVDYDLIPETECGSTLSMTNSKIQMVVQYMRNNFHCLFERYCPPNTLVLTHANFKPLLRRNPLATLILPNPTYSNLNIPSRYHNFQDPHLIVTRQTRNDSVILFSYMHKHFRSRLNFRINNILFMAFNNFE
jgi:DNA-binding protein